MPAASAMSCTIWVSAAPSGPEAGRALCMRSTMRSEFHQAKAFMPKANTKAIIAPPMPPKSAPMPRKSAVITAIKMPVRR